LKKRTILRVWKQVEQEKYLSWILKVDSTQNKSTKLKIQNYCLHDTKEHLTTPYYHNSSTLNRTYLGYILIRKHRCHWVDQLKKTTSFQYYEIRVYN
jgi:hypothetical protein